MCYSCVVLLIRQFVVLLFDVIVERGKTNEYYQGMAEHVLKQLDTPEHYFNFVQTILKNYHTLSKEHKEKIVSFLDVKPVVKTIIKENTITINEIFIFTF